MIKITIFFNYPTVGTFWMISIFRTNIIILHVVCYPLPSNCSSSQFDWVQDQICSSSLYYCNTWLSKWQET